MDRQHTIYEIVFILFIINLIHRTSAEEQCFPNINDYDDGYCECDDKSAVSCKIKNVPSNHTFWEKFRDISGFPTTVTINVLDTDISYFPSNLFLNLPVTVQEVKLKSWSFESIPKIPVSIASDNKSSLTLLEISTHESLTTISPHAFVSINSLRRLILSSNVLSNLTALSFKNLTMLQDLKLNQNNISSLPDGIFESLQKLGKLTLAQNEITSIKRETFIGLSLLQELDLSRNKLLIIKNDTFREMKKLRSLDLTYNSIDTIEAEAFRGLGALETLDLSDNHLRHLPNGMFKYFDNISLVDLKNNQLSQLAFDLLQHLPKITYLKDNPWICDCSLFIYFEKIAEWNKDTTCDAYVDFNRSRHPVEPVSMTFSDYADEIGKNPAKMEKCNEVNKTIEKRSHKVAANYNAKFINSSGNQLMPFMSFIFLMLLLPGLDN